MHVAETVAAAVEADLAAAAEELTDLERRVEEEAALPPAPARPPPGARRPLLAAAPVPSRQAPWVSGPGSCMCLESSTALRMFVARCAQGPGVAAPCHGPGCIDAS